MASPQVQLPVFGNVQEVGAKANVTNVSGHCHAFIIIELKFFGP